MRLCQKSLHWVTLYKGQASESPGPGGLWYVNTRWSHVARRCHVLGPVQAAGEQGHCVCLWPAALRCRLPRYLCFKYTDRLREWEPVILEMKFQQKHELQFWVFCYPQLWRPKSVHSCLIPKRIGPQPCRHQGLVSWKTIFPQIRGRGSMVWGLYKHVTFIVLFIIVATLFPPQIIKC